MQLKAPDRISVGVTAARGLLYNREAYAARADLFVIDAIAFAPFGVKLRAGEETPVPVEVASLRVNADVRRISAKLHVMADGSAEQVTPVSVKEGAGPKREFEIGVDATAGLRNVQVRLQGGQVIWSHGGAVPAGLYQMPDFAQQANAYLDGAKLSGDTVILQFLVKSETPGSVTITVDPNLEYALLQTQSWKNDLDSTFRVDRNLQLEFNSVEELPLDRISSAAGVIRSAIRLDVGGQVGPERLLGDVAVYDGKQSATISTDFCIAQMLTLDRDRVSKGIRCTGASWYLEADAPAELYVELQADAAGAPAAAAPLAKSNISVKPPDKGARQQWTFAPFQDPVDVNLETPYWVVIKAVRGSVRLGLQARTDGDGSPAPLGTILVNRGGDRWRCLAPAAGGRADACDSSTVALVGLVYLPDPDNQTAAIELDVAHGSAGQRFDPAAQPKNVTLDVSGDTRQQMTLVVRSHVRGTLTIANAVQEYTLT